MPMTTDQINELKAALGLDNIAKAAEAITAAEEARKAKEAEAARNAAEEARVKSLIDAHTGEDKQKLESALELVKALSDKLDAHDNKAFGETLEEVQESVKSLKEEIAAIASARAGKDSLAPEASKSAPTDVDAVVLLHAFVKHQKKNADLGMFETAYGAAHLKAVNASSSVQVSSESYETTFSQNLLRDIADQLVVGAMFTELPMSSKLLTMMVEERFGDAAEGTGVATWVDASTYGTSATVGNEIKTALQEITFKTHKLASKTYITDETDEDAIVALLPILRRHLVESHVLAIEKAFMGDGAASSEETGKPTGLLAFANIDGHKIETTAKADGSVKVTAKPLSMLRRHLGLKGLRMADLALITSVDAYYDLLEDDAWADVDQVGSASIKLQGQVGRIYGLPVVTSSFFPAKAVGKEFAVLVYRPDFVKPTQRDITVEYERRPSEQRDAYYATQRTNLQRYFANNVVSATYASA